MHKHNHNQKKIEQKLLSWFDGLENAILFKKNMQHD